MKLRSSGFRRLCGGSRYPVSGKKGREGGLVPQEKLGPQPHQPQAPSPTRSFPQDPLPTRPPPCEPPRPPQVLILRLALLK